MKVIVLKDTREFFFDEPVEIARCPICDTPMFLEPFKRIEDKRTFWNPFEKDYLIEKSMHCKECGHHLTVTIPASLHMLPTGWEVKYV